DLDDPLKLITTVPQSLRGARSRAPMPHRRHERDHLELEPERRLAAPPLRNAHRDLVVSSAERGVCKVELKLTALRGEGPQVDDVSGHRAAPRGYAHDSQKVGVSQHYRSHRTALP